MGNKMFDIITGKVVIHTEMLGAEEEEWKSISGYHGLYEISNLGRVKSLKRLVKRRGDTTRTVNERIMKIKIANTGYCHISLYLNSSHKTFLVHRLVAIEFIKNEDKENLIHINHIDENKINNKPINLEWCTSKYNNSFGTARARGDEFRKVKIEQLDLDGCVINEWDSITNAGKSLGLNAFNISSCCAGTRNYCGKFKWRYKYEQ